MPDTKTLSRRSSLKSRIRSLLSRPIAFGRSMCHAEPGSIILFPTMHNVLSCGISALVAIKPMNPETVHGIDLKPIETLVEELSGKTLAACLQKDLALNDNYLSGDGHLISLVRETAALKSNHHFAGLYADPDKTNRLKSLVGTITGIVAREKKDLTLKMPDLLAQDADTAARRIEKLQDACWCLSKELLANIDRVRDLSPAKSEPATVSETAMLKRINTVLNSIDRLEVRGRDSAGISLMMAFPGNVFESIRDILTRKGLQDQLRQRSNRKVLTNNTIMVHETSEGMVSIAMVYKFAAEIGALGDNVSFLRTQIRNDQILQVLLLFTPILHTISAHTRWASVGDITEANCHPVDNEPMDKQCEACGIIHVSLNGDIDNYHDLKADYEERYGAIHPDITTDTKIIPLQIDHYLRLGNPIQEAFRLALNDFKGSHAISMHTSLAPGKLFLAQKGSGQALFVGISPDGYLAASELYGLVEETQRFVKLNGENRGQIMVLDQMSKGGIQGLTSLTYAGNPISLTETDILSSEITSRDIDRQHYPHYFLKEISEAPYSVEKTLQNKWKKSKLDGHYMTVLDRSVISESLENDIRERRIKRIYFIGQGTAGVAAQGCATILGVYLAGTDMEIRALKSSELSGFSMRGDENDTDSMAEDLVVAISQSGTTTDTNRTVDMVKERGARTLSIVNRRDSDLTFKTDGVLYTSSGRDIEMSVASTKAFYSQITAGAILGLHIASIAGVILPETITREILELTSIPEKMHTILAMKDAIKASAMRLAVTKNYWATVGSGANKTSADEIRIKLSELCYKTISSDFVEDKKHIDLSSEPLIIICAAGTREKVLGDIIKDTAIFHAHKATPVVITHEGEDRFDGCAADVFKIPRISEHLAPVLNTLVGHIWGYYAALAINEGSRFMYSSRKEIMELLDSFTEMDHDVYEVILEKKFREKIAEFDATFSQKRREKKFPAALGLDTVSNITLLLKYLSGRLPVSDFEIDFAQKGTPANMLGALFKNMGEAINTMARPVDAIKHQAKTVTVGTSRISETFEGVVFDEFNTHNLKISQLTHRNVLVLKNLQQVISHVRGALLYRISGLNLLGELTLDTRIDVVAKTGELAAENSRVETDHKLKGTKNIIVREGNVYIGKGRKDSRSILVIPVLSSSPAARNTIEYILSINVAFKDAKDISLRNKIKALGGKYTRIKDIILETGDCPWDDKLLDRVRIEDLFGDSAEKIAEFIEGQR
ncbi:MAG: SIS domain-containing protein [Pseudomonadota bacterium]